MAALGDNPNNDMIVADSPPDSISSVSWSPVANILVAGSWNKEVRCWEIANNGSSVAKAMIAHDAPVLCTAFSSDGSRVFSGGCCKTAKMWDLASNQSQVVAKHDAPIKSLHYINDLNALATGSWDKTVRYWDCRQANPVGKVDLPERLYAMDVCGNLMVCGTAEGHIVIYDLRKPDVANRTMKSPLRFQTRCVATFPDQTGFAIGSIEGRVSINFLNERQNKTFAFKCHWQNEHEVYAVNCIAFHKQFGTFATCGSDGQYVFWDLVAKQRLKPFNRAKNSITSAAFNFDGSIFAYALSYDWSKGIEFNDPTRPNRVMLHSVQKNEIAPQHKK
jgi:mRNA export factor